MKLKSGVYKFKGIIEDTYKFKEYDESEIDANITYIKLNDEVYSLTEDPDDGYRSYGNLKLEENFKHNRKFNLENAEIDVYLEHKKDVHGDYKNDAFDGIILYSLDNKKTLAEFGTNVSDSYYPSCVCNCNIKEINTYIFNSQLQDILK